MIKKNAKIFIVIAAYNEGKSIIKVISELKKKGYSNIVVVDDGSKDDTYNIASSQNIHVLKHPINRGQGAALKTGIEFALINNADVIVTFDADGQHRVEDISKIITPVIKNEVDVTFGSRFLEKTNIPWFRKFTLKIAVLVLRIFYGVKMTDAHNGFRALNKHAAKSINITSDRMEHASQIVEEVHNKKLRYKEIPVIIKYTDYSMEKGHGGFIQGLKVLWHMFVRRFLM